MTIAPAAPHSSTYCFDQCGEDRVFPSTDFQKTDCHFLTEKQSAEIWEDEREAGIKWNVLHAWDMASFLGFNI
jgi:hypothetical protein